MPRLLHGPFRGPCTAAEGPRHAGPSERDLEKGGVKAETEGWDERRE